MALLSDQARVHAWVPFAARRTRETRRGPLRCPQPQRRCHRPPRHFPGPAYSGGARRARALAEQRGRAQVAHADVVSEEPQQKVALGHEEARAVVPPRAQPGLRATCRGKEGAQPPRGLCVRRAG